MTDPVDSGRPLSDEEIAAIQPAMEANPHQKPLTWQSSFVLRLVATIHERKTQCTDLLAQLEALKEENARLRSST